MNTPGHLIVGAALFSRRDAGWIILATFLGAAAPDISVIAMVLWAEHVQGHSPSHIFNVLYFSDAWQRVFAIDNSIILWSVGLAAAAWFRANAWVAFAGAGLAHLVLDLLLHHDDGRAHFWPVTMWRFESPVSYWDSAHYGNIAAAALFVLCVVAMVILWRRHTSYWLRGIFSALLAGEAYFASIWIRFF